MNTGQQQHRSPRLSIISAFRYFLKGNMLFAFNGVIIVAIDSIACIFPSLFQQVYTDSIITHKNPEWFTPLIALYILLFVVELLVWIIFSVLRRKSQARINITTSVNYLWTVLRLPMTLLTRFTPGELVARYTTIPMSTRQLDYALPAVSILTLPILCCYIVMLFNWKLGLLEIFSILLLVYVMRSTANKQKKIAMNLEVTEARLQNVTMTGIGNLDTIKALGGERYFFAQWEKTYAQSLNARVTTITNNIYLSALPEFVLQATNGVILCLGSWLILQGEMTPGMILASQGLINETIYPIIRAIASVQTVMRINSSIQRIKDVTDCSQESAELSLPAGDELPDTAKLAGEIELRDVTFGYDRSPVSYTHLTLPTILRV